MVYDGVVGSRYTAENWVERPCVYCKLEINATYLHAHVHAHTFSIYIYTYFFNQDVANIGSRHSNVTAINRYRFSVFEKYF